MSRWSASLTRLKQFLDSPGEDLASRVVHGGLWTVVQKFSDRALGFVRTVVLARLLAPHDFGLFGIALVTQATIDTVLEFGVDAALVQREETTSEYLDAAWTIRVTKSAIVALALVVLAPLAANFFDAPQAVRLIRVLALVVLLRGFQNVGVVYFRKELEIRSQFFLGFGGALAATAAAIGLALVLGSVWALMAGLLVGAVVQLVLSYVLHPYRPWLDFDLGRIRELWRFGKWLFGSSTLNFAAIQGDDILLGRWLGAASLGLYQIAYRLSNAVATEVTHVISGVTFPAYSKLQSRPAALRRAFLDTLSVTMSIVVPLAAAIALFIPEFVHYILGDKWLGIVAPVQVLSVAGLLRAMSACWGPLYMARGRTEKPFWKQLMRAVLTLAPAYPMAMRYGVTGVSACVGLGIGVALTYDLFWSGTKEEVGIGLGDVGARVAAPLLAAVGAACAEMLVQHFTAPGVLATVALAAVYGTAYAAGLLALGSRGLTSGWTSLQTLWARAEG